MNEDTTTSVTVASASLYASDVAQVEDFILRGKIHAATRGETYQGITIDIDENGFVELFSVGLDPIRL